MVFAVDPNSPSAVAGVRPGDIVIGFNGERIPEPTKLVLLLTRASIGGVSSLQILRDDEEQTLEVRIGRRPFERRRALP
jgi:S1-C subfamily serine protease